MPSILKQKGSYSVEKIYLIFVCLATLLPGFGAIDNNPVRWMTIGCITILFLFYSSYIRLNKSRINFQKSIIVVLSGIYLLFSCLNSGNLNESLITLYKIIIIISVFYASYIAIRRINNAFLLICHVFTISIFFETFYALIDFFIINDSFTGISQNRNISSSSLVIKLIFLIYLIDYAKSAYVKIFLQTLEILALLSIVLLQSRLGLISIFGIYFLYLILFRSSRKQIIFSTLIFTLFFFYFNNNNFENKIEKDFAFQDISNDESINQRLNFYQISIGLFNESPLKGNGLGSWKYRSIQNNKYKKNSVLVPYYTHNDFLQILMEIGIIGLFIYLTFFTLLIKNLLQKKGEKKFIPLIITLIIVIANSLINFPIHRTQEYIPFIICCAFIFSEKNFETERKKSNILPILILLLIPSIVISSYEYRSLRIQGILLNDYKNNTFSLSLNDIEQINYKLPNLSSNVVPVSTYLSRYYFNQGNYYESIKLLDYSLEINKLDLMTNELMLRNYIFTNQINKALILVKDLLKMYPENKNYSNILLAITKDLDSQN